MSSSSALSTLICPIPAAQRRRELRARFADAGKHDIRRRDAGALRAQELAVADHIRARAQLPEQARMARWSLAFTA